VKTFLGANEEVRSNSEDKAFNIQIGHSSNVTSGIYGRLLTEPMFSVKVKRYTLRLVSIK
jgi:hypothetical protein